MAEPYIGVPSKEERVAAIQRNLERLGITGRVNDVYVDDALPTLQIILDEEQLQVLADRLEKVCEGCGGDIGPLPSSVRVFRVTPVDEPERQVKLCLSCITMGLEAVAREQPVRGT